LAAIAAATSYGFGFILFALASVIAAVLATRATPTLETSNTDHLLISS
jgi:hypothetical protein